MIHGNWLNCVIDIDRVVTSSFAGDDADQYSELVDLGRHYEKLIILVPTIQTGTVTIYAQELAAVTTVPKPLQKADGSATWTIASGAGDVAVACDCLGGFRYIRLKTSVNQTGTDKTFRVMGARS